MYDVVIIGAGVSGCAIARELAKYRGRICVLEQLNKALFGEENYQEEEKAC